MPFSVEQWMRDVLKTRGEQGTLRELAISEPGLVDFCSNDYLGLARSSRLQTEIDSEMLSVKQNILKEYGNAISVVGSGGSRLLAGNSSYVENLEIFISSFHDREAALVFNSGYDANLGILSCLPQVGDAVVYDELVHNSMRMGIQLGRQSNSIPFRHNDISHLKSILSSLRNSFQSQRIFIAVESIYSMDGDSSPLNDILEASELHCATVIIDEAHATGVLGLHGEGLVQSLGLQHSPALLCSVHTFGKALGTHGAVVVGSKTLKSFLINYARPLIYSTSLPLHSLVAIKCAYKLQSDMTSTRSYLHKLIKLFREGLVSKNDNCTAPLQINMLLESSSPIQAVLVPGNETVIKVSKLLRDHGYDVKPIRKPTVKEGTERLRICVHAHNTETEILGLVHCIRAFIGSQKCHHIEKIEKRSHLNYAKL